MLGNIIYTLNKKKSCLNSSLVGMGLGFLLTGLDKSQQKVSKMR